MGHPNEEFLVQRQARQSRLHGLVGDEQRRPSSLPSFACSAICASNRSFNTATSLHRVHASPSDMLQPQGLEKADTTKSRRPTVNQISRSLFQKPSPGDLSVQSRLEATMIVKEVRAKTILSVSKVYDYVINPYTGCQHACSYCYARFMKRFSGHKEPWGAFVDVKINASDLLRAEVAKKKRGRVWISGVCDPYQPLERKFQLTRKCLEIMAQTGWPVTVQTRSPLVVRDLDILRAGSDWHVGLSVTTADDHIRSLFEPAAPPIANRIQALDELHRAGIKTYAMIAPILPGALDLAESLQGKVDYVLVDRMNYNHADWVYRKHGLEDTRSDGYFLETGRELALAFKKIGVACDVVF